MKKLALNVPYVYYSESLDEFIIATQIVAEENLPWHKYGWNIEYGGEMAHLTGTVYLHPEHLMLMNNLTTEFVHPRFKQIGTL